VSAVDGPKTTRSGGLLDHAIRHPLRGSGYSVGMAESTRTRRRALLLVVLGILAVLAVLLLVGTLLGDDTDQIDPQNGEVITAFLR
jgi:hypothetical protein